MSLPLIVVLGLGDAGVVHARALAKHRNIRLGLACRRRAVLDAFATELNADAKYTTYDSVFADDAVAAVVIATPATTHVALVEAAAAAAKHVLCEKPLCYDVAAIRRAVQAVESAGIRFMTALTRRWDAGYRHARALVRAGALGRVTTVHANLCDPFYPQKYVDTPGAHLFYDVCVHDADAVAWLTGRRVVRVFASGATLGEEGVEAVQKAGKTDVVAAVLELEGGARALVHVSLVAGYGNSASGDVVGTKGTVRFGDVADGPHASELIADGEARRRVAQTYKERFAAAFDAQMGAFVALVVATGMEAKRMVEADDAFADVRAGLHASCVVDAMRRSHESGAPVKVDYDGLS